MNKRTQKNCFLWTLSIFFFRDLAFGIWNGDTLYSMCSLCINWLYVLFS